MRKTFDRMIATWPDLPLMPVPCSDCAVTCGFYGEYAQTLKEEPDDVREAVTRKWFCHSNPGKACRGNADFQGVSDER